MSHGNAKLNLYGSRLIVQRIESGLSQAQVAEAAGVSRSTVTTTTTTESNFDALERLAPLIRQYADESERHQPWHGRSPTR